jgi:hypothetical protein
VTAPLPGWAVGDGPGVLARVRAGCAAVAASARFVRIRDERIGPVAAGLAEAGVPAPAWDRAHHFIGNPADTAAFVLALDSVNFGSGWWPVLRKRPEHSGYLTIAASLTERFRERGAWSAEELVGLTPGACAEVFGQDPAGPAADLMALYARALKDLGRFLLRDWDGDPLGPFVAADGSAERLVALLLRMPLFRDAAAHGGAVVPILKRAQLLAADAALALPLAGSGAAAFGDLDRLTIFADNLVPHVLRLQGVLAYDPLLLARIERCDLIPPGSAEETEIRAVALHAAELLVAELRRLGSPATAAQLDGLLWQRGQDPAIKAHPRHRTRTTAY